jgi:hypothetical protein
MNRYAILCGFAVAAISVATAAADPPSKQLDSGTVTIPLDQIWANHMPGTRDIYSLEPDIFSTDASSRPAEERARRSDESLLNQIGSRLQPSPVVNPGPVKIPKPRPAFAVLGDGRKALEAANSVLIQERESQESFPAGSELSLVFFSHQAGSRVHLVAVLRRGFTIEIRYRFYADGLAMRTSHIALIPLGQLPAGKYHVEISQSPMGDRFNGVATGKVMKDWGQKLVCSPFSFSVDDPQD